MTCDAVVVGSGHNALLAAALLARAGWQVIVLEQAKTIGGATRTEELTLPGFSHDIASVIHSLFALSPAYGTLRSELAACGLHYIWASTPYTAALNASESLTLHGQRERTCAELEQWQAGDGAAWLEFLRAFDRGGSLWTDLLFGPARSPSTAFRALALARRLGRQNLSVWLRDALSSSGDFATRTFQHAAAQAWLAAWALNLGFGPSDAGGGLFTWLPAALAQQHGVPLPRHGSGSLPRALAQLITRNGGTVITGTTVERILVSKRRAVGVRLADGGEIEARKAVIAGVTPTSLYLHLIDAGDLESRWLRRAEGFRYGSGTFMLHAALKSAPRWANAPPDALFAQLGPAIDGMALSHAQGRAGILPDTPPILACCPTLLDSTRAPGGKHVLWLQVTGVPATIRGDSAGVIQGRSWPAIKEQYADRILRRVECYAPGIGGSIEAVTSHSPLDMQEGNPNLRGGDLTGGSHGPDQQAMLRPLPGLGGYRTPIKSLYHIGASTFPGAGVSGASGWKVARSLLR